ncbi:MAG: phage baseplate assembly protein V [Kofleriaceae bacterium]
MGLGSDTFRQLEHLLRPLRNRIANAIARSVVQLVDDGKRMQRVQLGVLAGEDVEGEGGGEHFQPYGFSSVPLAGAEGVVVFPNGDRGHPLVVVVSDRRYRPTDGEPGEVTVYNHTGAKIVMTKDGDIEVQPAPGREVYVRDEDGSADRLVKKSEFDGHRHPAIGLACTGGTVSGQTGGAPEVTGTQRLRAQ